MFYLKGSGLTHIIYSLPKDLPINRKLNAKIEIIRNVDDFMNNDEFKNMWSLTYPNSYPISYTLKHIFHERWFRVHYLPDSQRYPTNDEDTSLLLIRYNLLIADLIEVDEEYYLLVASYHEQAGMPEGYESLLDIGKFVELEGLPMHKIESDNYEPGKEYYLRMAIRKSVWQDKSLDKLLMAVANWQISNVIILAKDFNRLLCPYDGGMDIVLENEELKNTYQHKYRTWLSNREDGL